MIFSMLEDKGRCIGVFQKGGLSFGDGTPEAGVTWAYNRHLRGNTDIQYAKIVAPHPSIASCVPSDMAAELERLATIYRAHLQSLFSAHVDLIEQCTYDYIPEWFLVDYYRIRNEAIEYIWEAHGGNLDEDFHGHMVRTWELASDIQQRALTFDAPLLRRLAYDGSKVCKDVLNGRRGKVKYDLFRTATGRFATNEWSFPVHNLKKNVRNVLLPRNDQFLELDFNAADVRALLALSDGVQPDIDIHMWNIENVFAGEDMDRDEAKTRFFSWLYSKRLEKRLEMVYDRDVVVGKRLEAKAITNPYGRKMILENSKDALSYLLQSTVADLTHEKAYALAQLLRYKKSFIAFTMYDSVIIDLANEDIPLIDTMKKEFSETRFGHWLTNISLGCNFGEMKKQ